MLRRYYWPGQVLGAAGLLALAACADPVPLPSKVGLLTQHGWQLTDWTTSPGLPRTANGTTTTYTSLIDYYRAAQNPCPLLLHLTFAPGPPEWKYEEGAYTYQQGQAGCGSQQVAYASTWFTDASAGKNLLYLRSNSGYFGIYTINELSANRLVLTYRASQSGNATVYTLTQTFSPE